MTTVIAGGAGGPVRLAAERPGRLSIAGRLTIAVRGQPVELELTAPSGTVSVQDLLPIFQGLTDFYVDDGAARARAEGREISCRAGCGACCRQLVPIGVSEARALAQLVAALPAERSDAVRARFDAALAAYDAAGLLRRLRAAPRDAAEDMIALSLEYFAVGIACPFLEAEACSIHPQRPLVCREYLVTTPAAHCEAPSPQTIERVELAAHPSGSLYHGGKDVGDGGWLPLVLALEFAAASPSPPRTHGAPEILRAVIGAPKDAAPHPRAG